MQTSSIVMRAVLLIILILLWAQTAGAQVQATDQSLFTTIEINENGNAIWTTEMRTSLSTLSMISEWNLSLKDTNKTKKDLEDFSARINSKIRSAENYSQRPMLARDFNISYETINIQSNSYGIIRLSFEWVGFSLYNFSLYNNSTIMIGDAFSEEEMPSSNNVLIIKIPKGYDVVNATPGFDKRDGNRLIWDGTMYRSFAKGEPNVVLQYKAADQGSSPSPSMDFIFIALIGASLFIIWMKRDYFWKKRVENAEKAQRSDMNAVQTVAAAGEGAPVRTGEEIAPIAGAAQLAQTGVNIAAGTGAVQPSLTGIEITADGEGDESDDDETTYSGSFNDLPALTEDILGDEEMIEKYLARVGGQSYQSDIVKESGLSKSKISIVLAKMKEEGRILKIRKGKENIIRLAIKEKVSTDNPVNSEIKQ